MNAFNRILSNEKISVSALYVWVAILSVLYSLLSVLRHMHFQSGAFDLGIYDQAVWQSAHFFPLFNTIKEKFIFGDHLVLTLPLLAPLFWIWDDVRILLIFQAVFISMSTIAIYLLSRHRGFAPIASLCLAFIYSIFFGIQFAVYFDFHPVVIGVGLLSWFVYFFETKKTGFMWSTLIALLLTQENMGIAVACIGCIYIFKKEFRKAGYLFILGGLTASLISVKIVSLMSPSGYQYWPTYPMDPVAIVTRFFDSHEKVLVWLYSFGWFSFIPVFSPGAVLAVFLDLSQYFLPQVQFGHMVTPFLHHRAILGPLLLLGTLDALAGIRKKWYFICILGLLIISSLVQQFVFHHPLNKLSKNAYWNQESWMQDTHAIFAQLPRDASVAAAQNIVPHLSHRKEIYLVYPRIQDAKCTGCWWLEFAGKPDYLVADVHPGQWSTQLLETVPHFTEAISNMVRLGRLVEYARQNDAYIYTITYK